jgi:hypothetical protein
MDMRSGTWNVRSIYKIGSLLTVVRELGKYKIDLVCVQVRWEKGGTVRAEDYTFFYGQGNEDHQLRRGFLLCKKIVSAVRRVEFISDRLSYIILRGCRCNITVLNLHAPYEDKGVDVKDSLYEELVSILDQFPRHDTKIVLGDFNAEVDRENIFKPTNGNESLHEISNDSGVGIVNLATSKNFVFRSTLFPYRKIHKYNWTPPEGNTHNEIDHILIKDGIQVYLISDFSEELSVILTTI